MKTRVVVVYGGESTEHEISCRSAAFVLGNIDREKYEVSAIAIDQQGRWLQQNPERLLSEVSTQSQKKLPIYPTAELPPQVVEENHLAMQSITTTGQTSQAPTSKIVFFPVVHGTSGEDGAMQGFFDLSKVAYVGPPTLGAAMAMDKVIAKQRVEAAGVAVVPYKQIRYEAWLKNPRAFSELCIKDLGEKVFIKPANLGSSVGVSPAVGAEECHKACENAFTYDDKIIVETSVDAREIECAALGGYEPEISQPGEVVAHGGFYSYDAKYTDPNASTIKVPAELSDEQADLVRRLAKQAFMALELYGMARMDFFLCKQTGKFYFNEANTIPGFTEISQYPQLWKHSGLDEKSLISRLIELAEERQRDKLRLQRVRGGS